MAHPVPGTTVLAATFSPHFMMLPNATWINLDARTMSGVRGGQSLLCLRVCEKIRIEMEIDSSFIASPAKAGEAMEEAAPEYIHHL
jgi:hypothetical protein